MSEEGYTERLSVVEAAEALGVTRDAIHKRIRRGTIRHEKGEDGRFYVFVDTSTTELGMSADESKDKSKVEALERLIDNQHERIAFLERELERRGDEAETLHRIVAGLTQVNAQLSARLPELEAPSELRESPVSPGPNPTPQPPDAEPHGAAERPTAEEEGPERSWWRRFFGF